MSSYQVIARKYRPQRFSDVVGQDHVTRTLANAIQNRRIAHAYLFVGPRGTGKTTIARIFSKCLNATNGPTVDFDEHDERVKEITESRSMDVMEIDGASNRGVEEIRELRETVRYAPASGKFKIYIIDEVHMLTKEAFNALLKTLEEPPEHVKFMFATTEPDKVLPTILSRCQRFDLRRIPIHLIIDHLRYIARQEGVEIDDAALNAIARGSEGCMRDAESTLDQLISFCGKSIVESDVLSMFGLAARGQIQSLAASILDGDGARTLSELSDLARKGKELQRLLSDLLQHFRNILLLRVSNYDANLVEAPEAELEVFKEHAQRIGTEALARIMEILTHCESRLRDAASKKIFVEINLLKAIQARNAVDINTVLEELKQLRQTGTDDSQSPVPSLPSTPPASSRTSPRTHQATVPPKKNREPPPSPSTTKQAGQEPSPASSVSRSEHSKSAKAESYESEERYRPSSSTSNLEVLWQELVEAVGRASPFTKTYLLQAHLVSFDKGILVIGFDPEFRDSLDIANNQRNATLIHTKMRELGHPDVRVKFVETEAPAGWSPATNTGQEAAPSKAETRKKKEGPQQNQAPAKNSSASAPSGPMDMEEFKNDPLIKQALEIFKGQIVDIRT